MSWHVIGGGSTVCVTSRLDPSERIQALPKDHVMLARVHANLAWSSARVLGLAMEGGGSRTFSAANYAVDGSKAELNC
jgi:hypothetical protein